MSPGKVNTKIDRKLRAVAVWYVLLAALEDVETQRRGFCFLVNPKTVSIRQVRSNRWIERTSCLLRSLLARGRATFDATTSISL